MKKNLNPITVVSGLCMKACPCFGSGMLRHNLKRLERLRVHHQKKVQIWWNRLITIVVTQDHFFLWRFLCRYRHCRTFSIEGTVFKELSKEGIELSSGEISVIIASSMFTSVRSLCVKSTKKEALIVLSWEKRSKNSRTRRKVSEERKIPGKGEGECREDRDLSSPRRRQKPPALLNQHFSVSLKLVTRKINKQISAEKTRRGKTTLGEVPDRHNKERSADATSDRSRKHVRATRGVAHKSGRARKEMSDLNHGSCVS